MDTIVRYVEDDPIDITLDDAGDMINVSAGDGGPIDVISDAMGLPGLNGWTASLAVVPDGARRVHRVVDWFGGTGSKPATGDYLGVAGLTPNIGDAIDVRGVQGQPGQDGDDGAPGAPGEDGDQGDKGWSPVLVVVADGDRRVYQLQAWVGGAGAVPDGAGKYLGAAGLVDTAAAAVDVRGPKGDTGATGDITPAAQTALDAATTQNTNTVNAANALLASVSALSLLIAAYATTAQTAAAGAVNVAQTNLSAAARAIVLATDVAASFIYDTTRDSDGGAWRDKVGGLRWIEQIGRFPSKVLIVGRLGTVDVVEFYNFDDPTCPLLGKSESATNLFGWAGYNNDATAISITALNGLVVIGTNGSTTSRHGLAMLDFVKGEFRFLRPTASAGPLGPVPLEFSKTYSTADMPADAGTPVPSNLSTNSVAATILPHTPTNPLRCDLPNPTLAAATNGGVSVFRSDGVVCNSSITSAYNMVSFTSDGTLISNVLNSGTNIAAPGSYLVPSWNPQSVGLLRAAGITTPSLGGNPLGAIAVGKLLATYGASGLTFLHRDPHNLANSMAAFITDKFNTGYQHGAARAAFAESSADLSSLTGISYGPELVTRGSFDKVTGWDSRFTGGGLVGLSVTPDGYLRLTSPASNPDQTSGRYVITGVTVGKTYRILFDWKARTNITAMQMQIADNANGSSGIIAIKQFTNLADANEVWVTATTTTLNILPAFAGNTVGTMDLDNISCKEVIGELVQNGKLDQGTTGWANGSGTEVVSVVAGRLRVAAGAAATYSYAKQTLTGLVANRYHLLKVDIPANTNASGGWWVTIAGVQVFTGTTTGSKTFLFKPTGATHELQLILTNDAAIGNYVEFDNISVMPLAGIDKPNLVTNGAFPANLNGWTGASGAALQAGATWDASGRMRLSWADSGNTATLAEWQLAGCVAGRTYEMFYAQEVSGVGTNRTRVILRNSTNNGNLTGGGYATGSNRVVGWTFVADGATPRIQIMVDGDVVALIDNVIVREVDTGLGANLVANGTFNDATGWTLTNGATISGGVLTLGGNAASAADYALTFASGKVYRVSWDQVGAGNACAFANTNSSSNTQNASGYAVFSGRRTAYLIGAGLTANLRFGSNSAVDTVTIDNIEVREVTDSLIYNGTFEDASGWSAPATATVAATNGQIVVTQGSGVPGYSSQMIPIVSGRRYAFKADWLQKQGGGRIFLGSVAGTQTYGLFTIAGVGLNSEFVATGSELWISLGDAAAVNGSVNIYDNIALTEIAPELVANGTFNVSGGDVIESWVEATTGTGTVSVANGVATLAGGTGTASIKQTLTGLTVGQPYRHRVTVSSAPVTVTVAGINQSFAVGAQTIEFVPTATSHDLTFAVGAGVTAGVTGVSVQAVQGLVLYEGFDTDLSAWTMADIGAPTPASITGGVVNLPRVDNGNISRIAKLLNVVAGQSYRIMLDVFDAGVTVGVYSTATGGVTNFGVNVSTGVGREVVFTALAGDQYLRINSGVNAATPRVDNIKITRIASDRSVAGNHATVYGTLSRVALGGGSELAAYGGFSAANYLETGNDFSGAVDGYVAAWVIPTGAASGTIYSWQDNNGHRVYLSPNGFRVLRSSGLHVASTGITTTAGVPVFLVGVIRGSRIECYVNGRLASVVTGVSTLAFNGTATGRIGLYHDGTTALSNATVALLRAGTSSPTADQIAAMYEAERPLLTRPCLLLGSANVQGLAADNDNGKVFAATAVGTNEFTGLVRTGYRQSSLGSNVIPYDLDSGGQQFAPTAGTVTAANVAPPSGVAKAFLLTATGANAMIGGVTIGIATDGATVTRSVRVKKGNNPTVFISHHNTSTTSFYRTFNLDTLAIGGTAGSNPFIKDEGGGWFSIGFALPTASAAANARFGVGIVGGVAGDTLYVAGPMGVIGDTGYQPYVAPLTRNDNHKAVAAADGNLVIATGAGVEAYLPAIPLRERATARRGVAPYDPTRGVHRVVTADAASTPITVIPVPEGKAFSFRARIASAQYGGAAAERASYVVEGIAWRDVGGNVQVALHTNLPGAIEVTVTMDATGAANTTAQAVSFNVVGKAATRMAWVNTLEWVDVGLGAAA